MQITCKESLILKIHAPQFKFCIFLQTHYTWLCSRHAKCSKSPFAEGNDLMTIAVHLQNAIQKYVTFVSQ